MNIRRLQCFFSARSCSTSLSEICGTQDKASRKRSRLGVKPLISFILVICTLFSFSVSSYAAQTFTYRLSDFSFYEGDRPSTFASSSYLGKSVTKVAFNSSSSVRICAYVKLTSEFKIGASYTLNFSVSKGSGTGLNGLTLYLASSLPFDDTDSFIIADITSDELISTSYKDYSVQLTLPDSFNGKQVYLAALIASDNNASSLFVTDFVFTNNNNTEEKIDGILEWLSATYHGIVGGEDSRGVQHDGLVQGIKNGLSGLGDRISVFFNNLGNKIGGFFSSIGDRIGDFFARQWENISGAFEAVKNTISRIGDSITAKFQEIGDKFTSFFDTFKPRVYEEFLWQIGSVSYNTGQLSPFPKERASTSEMFYVADGSVYILEFDPKNNNSSQQVSYFILYQYDADGNYIKSISHNSFSSATSYTFEAGYNYRISVASSSSFSGQSSYELSKFCNSRVKVYCDEGWINALIHALMNGLKKLFIPAPGYFDTRFEDVKSWASEHFGIVYTAGNLSIDVLKKIYELKTACTICITCSCVANAIALGK